MNGMPTMDRNLHALIPGADTVAILDTESSLVRKLISTSYKNVLFLSQNSEISLLGKSI